MTWIMLVAALAAEPAVQDAPSKVSTQELKAAEIAPGEGPEVRSVPMLSQSTGGRAVRLVAESVAGNVGALAGTYALAVAGYIVGDLVGGCTFMGVGAGNGCWYGGMIGALAGHPLGLILATHFTGHLLGTDTPLAYTALGALVGEGAMLGAWALVQFARGGDFTNGPEWAVLMLPGVVAAVFHELGDNSAERSPVVVAPMALRNGGGLMVLAAF